MRSSVSVAGSYYKIEIRNWCLWITVDHTRSYGVTRAPLQGFPCKVVGADIPLAKITICEYFMNFKLSCTVNFTQVVKSLCI